MYTTLATPEKKNPSLKDVEAMYKKLTNSTVNIPNTNIDTTKPTSKETKTSVAIKQPVVAQESPTPLPSNDVSKILLTQENEAPTEIPTPIKVDVAPVTIKKIDKTDQELQVLIDLQNNPDFLKLPKDLQASIKRILRLTEKKDRIDNKNQKVNEKKNIYSTAIAEQQKLLKDYKKDLVDINKNLGRVRPTSNE